MIDSALPPVKARFSVNILENTQSELLFLKRSQATKFGPGLWGFPAGHIEQGESPHDCALRELGEEIGIIFEIEELASVGPVRDSFFGGIYELYLYHHRWHQGEVTLNHEHTDFSWVARDAYRNYSVMDGIDEDIRYFNIWPERYLNKGKLP